MKYIVLSFDDGRKDFYTNALPVLQRYGLPATLNIISDYMGKSNLPCFASGNYECLSWEEAKYCKDNGIEIANHSANHSNTISEIIRGVKEITNQLNITDSLGFASPGSFINAKNIKDYSKRLTSNIKYIRSGNQIRRDGLFYAFLYIAYKYTKSCLLFYFFNKRNIIDLTNKDCLEQFYPSITCNNDNTISQIIRFIKIIPDGKAVILMFHSILNKTDSGIKKDKWYNTVQDFEQLCSFLAKSSNICVITHNQLYNMMINRN